MSTAHAQPARPVRSEAEELVCEVSWRVPREAITLQAAREFLAAAPADCSLVCRVERRDESKSVAFFLEAGGRHFPVGDVSRAAILRDGVLLHVDAHDSTGVRTLALTITVQPPTRVLYAYALAWNTLGVAGGRYDPPVVSTLPQ